MAQTPLKPAIGLSAVAIAALVGMFYALLTKTVDEFLHGLLVPTAMVASPILLASLWSLIGPTLTRAGRTSYGASALVCLAVGIIFQVYAFVVYGLGHLAIDLLSWLQRPSLSKPISVIAVAGAVGAVGLVLFYFRLRVRFVYGITEVIAGLVVSTVKVFTELPQDLTISASWTLALLTAGVYLVVRGLDNMHQGLTKEPIDASLLWLLQWIPGTTRAEPRRALAECRRKFRSTSVRYGRSFGRKALIYENPTLITQRKDYMGRLHTIRRQESFVLIDDDSLIFRVPLDLRESASSVPGAIQWRPDEGGSPSHDWIAVPHKSRNHWLRVAEIAFRGVGGAA